MEWTQKVRKRVRDVLDKSEGRLDCASSWAFRQITFPSCISPSPTNQPHTHNTHIENGTEVEKNALPLPQPPNQSGRFATDGSKHLSPPPDTTPPSSSSRRGPALASPAVPSGAPHAAHRGRAGPRPSSGCVVFCRARARRFSIPLHGLGWRTCRGYSRRRRRRCFRGRSSLPVVRASAPLRLRRLLRGVR